MENDATVLKGKIKEIIADLETRQERMVPGQSGYVVCGDVIKKLKDSIADSHAKDSAITFKPHGRPVGSRNRNLVFED